MTLLFPCASCGKPCLIEDLDAKAPAGSADFTILECKDCYGQGFVQGPGRFSLARPKPPINWELILGALLSGAITLVAFVSLVYRF